MPGFYATEYFSKDMHSNVPDLVVDVCSKPLALIDIT